MKVIFILIALYVFVLAVPAIIGALLRIFFKKPNPRLLALLTGSFIFFLAEKSRCNMSGDLQNLMQSSIDKGLSLTVPLIIFATTLAVALGIYYLLALIGISLVDRLRRRKKYLTTRCT